MEGMRGSRSSGSFSLQRNLRVDPRMNSLGCWRSCVCVCVCVCVWVGGWGRGGGEDCLALQCLCVYLNNYEHKCEFVCVQV